MKISFFFFLVKSSGDVVVSDTGNNKIKVYDSGGRFKFEFGSHGNEDGKFHDPKGVCIGNNGEIYVSDLLNDRVQVFDPIGNFIRKIK